MIVLNIVTILVILSFLFLNFGYQLKRLSSANKRILRILILNLLWNAPFLHQSFHACNWTSRNTIYIWPKISSKHIVFISEVNEHTKEWEVSQNVWMIIVKLKWNSFFDINEIKNFKNKKHHIPKFSRWNLTSMAEW